MIRLALAFLLCPAMLNAQMLDYVTTRGPLSDNDFYNLIACAAPPGDPCAEPIVRWSATDARDVTVAFQPTPKGYPRDLQRHMQQALDNAIAQINGTTPGLRLRQIAKTSEADVRIFLSTTVADQPIHGTGMPELDGEILGAAMVQVWWNDNLDITRAAIVMGADIPNVEAGPIMLEELTQSLGLLTDIRNPYYETRSVFSEDSNAITKLGPQDRMVLRRHYP